MVAAAVLVVLIAALVGAVFLANRWLSSPARESPGVAVAPAQSPSGGGVPQPAVESGPKTGIGGETSPALGGAPKEALSKTRTGAETPSPRPRGVTPEHPGAVSSLVVQSKLVHRVDPVYPELAKRARVEGTVFLRITVNEKGRVSRAEVTRGNPLLTQSALDAVRQWKYTPTLVSGRPVPVDITVVIHYKL